MNVDVNSRPMLIERIVSGSAERAPMVAAFALVLAVIVVAYVAGHFAMSTDTYALLSPKLPWRERETAFNTAFPQGGSKIVVIVDGKTPELSESAAAALARRLRSQPALFRAVDRPDAGAFWSHNAMLFAPIDVVRARMAQLIRAEPLLGPLAADPSIRGVMNALSTLLQGVRSGDDSPQQLRRPIEKLAEGLESLRTGKPTFFSWRYLVDAGAPQRRELRHIILVDPILAFDRLEPGRTATRTIRQAVQSLRLDGDHGVSVRLTGPVPLQDDELATLAERAPLIATLAIGAIVSMLWLAVRSVRLIAAILATMLLGLASATALGLAIFGRFNVISVAFIPLFVGLGIDIGIQLSVRYRAERSAGVGVHDALTLTARGIGRSLLLAATAIATGFFAFVPTDYYGVSQLGVIAGFGMFIALALNLTVLPALIRLTRPAGAAARSADFRLERIDDFVLAHRRLVVGTGIVAAAVSAAVLPLLHFDFNPIHLRNPRVESVAALFDLIGDPDQSPNTLEVILPDAAAAASLAASFRAIPEVADARSIASFIPEGQNEKAAVIADAANLLDLVLNPIAVATVPSDGQVVDSLNRAASGLHQAAAADVSMRVDADRLAAELTDLAASSPALRIRAAQTLMPGLSLLLDQIRDSLAPQAISLATLPDQLRRGWLLADGRARVSVTPKGDSNDDRVLRRFVAAGTQLAPDATGTAVSVYAGGAAVVRAFVEAGALSFVAITALLLAALRRLRDVAITMAPIVLTGLLTLSTCLIIGQPLNFANIIALPLLFGIGVAFHIYFVMSWRAGGAHLLTSSLARAVFFSALATATGFGSLWASSHPGTASMGKLLMISLVWTLISALGFQPALMGEPPICGARSK